MSLIPDSSMLPNVILQKAIYCQQALSVPSQFPLKRYLAKKKNKKPTTCMHAINILLFFQEQIVSFKGTQIPKGLLEI